MNYKEMNKETFYSLELSEQIKIVNNGLQEEKTLQKVCDIMGVARKHVSEKFRKAGYVFSKLDKGFFKPEEIISTEELPIKKKETVKQAEIKEVKLKSPSVASKNTSNTSKNTTSGEVVVSSFDFYYQPSGTSKKMGASVDTEVLKQFEILCSKFNFINTSAHVSNALALYIQKMNSK